VREPGRTADPSASLGMTKGRPALPRTVVAKQTLTKALPSPLSSRAQPRDLQCAPAPAQTPPEIVRQFSHTL